MGERQDAARQLGAPGGRTFSTAFRARYRIADLLGRGGMGEVYRAVQKDLGREVAVKFTSATGESERARFLREGALQASLRHPNVLQVFDAGEEQGRLYLVFEIVDGESLAMRIADQGPLPLQETLEVARQTCAALAHVHERGILHRDLKSDNILLTADGTAKVCDFGLAIQAEGGRRLTQYGVVMGTPGYLAPELAMGGTASAASDLYAFGCVLFEMLTGEVPYPLREPDGTERGLADVIAAHVQAPVPQATSLRPETPDSVEAIVQRCLRKRPEERFGTAAELALALERAVGDAASVERGRRQVSRATTQHVRPGAQPVRMSARATMVAPAQSGVGVSPGRRRVSPGWLALEGGAGLAVAVLFALSSRAVPERPDEARRPGQAGVAAVATPVAPRAPQAGAAKTRSELRLSAGAGSVRVSWDPTGPAPQLLRFGPPGQMTAQARVPPGRSWVELSGIQQASICAVEPRWPDGSAGPVSTTATLVRALDVTVLQPGIWRDGRASWESSGNRLLFFPDVPDGHPIQPRLSEDAGATWLTSPGLPFPLTWTSLRTCSQGDRLWLARTRKGATGLEILLAMSPDAGRSWEPPRVLAAGLASGLLALLPDGPDLDLFVWQGERTVHARVAAGVDGPLLFEPVGDFPRESWAGAARTGDGTIHVLGRCSALPRRLLYTRLLRGQRNWQPAAPYPGGAADGEAPVLTVSGQRLYAVWLNPAARREEPVLVFGRSLDAGRTWSAPRPLTQTAFLPDSTQEGMLRYSLVADGEVVGLAFQDDVGFISSRVRLLRSLDGGDAFTELASARVSAGKVMGASLRALPDATVYGLFLASLEVHGLVRFPPLLPAGKPSAGLGPSTRIH